MSEALRSGEPGAEASAPHSAGPQGIGACSTGQLVCCSAAGPVGLYGSRDGLETGLSGSLRSRGLRSVQVVNHMTPTDAIVGAATKHPAPDRA